MKEVMLGIIKGIVVGSQNSVHQNVSKTLMMLLRNQISNSSV